MHKLGVAITDEIYEALVELSKQRSGAPISNIVREYIVAGLEKDGVKVEAVDMKWGGKRSRPGGDAGES